MSETALDSAGIRKEERREVIDAEVGRGCDVRSFGGPDLVLFCGVALGKLFGGGGMAGGKAGADDVFGVAAWSLVLLQARAGRATGPWGGSWAPEVGQVAGLCRLLCLLCVEHHHGNKAVDSLNSVSC